MGRRRFTGRSDCQKTCRLLQFRNFWPKVSLRAWSASRRSPFCFPERKENFDDSQPNNPDTHRLARDQLIDVAGRLARRGGHLVVDEAFIDPTPDQSIAALAGGALPNVIVLRSLGKFFGLAAASQRLAAMLAPLAAADALRVPPLFV